MHGTYFDAYHKEVNFYDRYFDSLSYEEAFKMRFTLFCQGLHSYVILEATLNFITIEVIDSHHTLRKRFTDIVISN